MVFIPAFGRNVSPEWVESELLAHPAIAQAVVWGEAQADNVAVLVPRRADIARELSRFEALSGQPRIVLHLSQAVPDLDLRSVTLTHGPRRGPSLRLFTAGGRYYTSPRCNGPSFLSTSRHDSKRSALSRCSTPPPKSGSTASPGSPIASSTLL